MLHAEGTDRELSFDNKMSFKSLCHTVILISNTSFNDRKLDDVPSALTVLTAKLENQGDCTVKIAMAFAD